MRSAMGALVLGACLGAISSAGAAEWVKLADAPEDPAGREIRPGQLGAWCYAPELRGFILYGGRSPCFQNGMWLFDPAKKEWRMLRADDTVTREPLPAWQKAAANDPFAGGAKGRVRRPEEIRWSEDRPGAGDSHGACYDPVGKTVWFLGGYRYDGGGGLGLWKYLPAQDRFEAPAPDPVKEVGGTRLAFDVERRLLVAVPVMPKGPGSSGVYSTASGEWKPVEAPKAGPYPALAYDAGAKVAVLFTADGKTWTFDGSAWKAAQPRTSPPARGHAGMCYVPEAGGVVLVGGALGESMSWVHVERDKKGAIYRDAWVYSVAQDAWKDLGASGLPKESSPGRSYHCDALAYDPGSASAVLFDSAVGVWALGFGAGRSADGGAPPPAAPPASAQTAPAGEGTGPRRPNPKIESLGENAWVNLGSRVPGGWEVGLAYDEASRMLFRYGGCGTGPSAWGDYGYSNMMCLADLSGPTWHIRRPTHMYGGERRPINGCGRAYAYDPAHKVIWTINGVSSGGTGGKGGMYCYDAALDKFEGPFGGPHATSTAMCYSPDHDLVLLLNRRGASHVFDVKARTWKETAKGPETSGYDQIVYLPASKQFLACLRTPTGEFADRPDYASTGPTRALHKDKKTGKYAVVKMTTFGFDPAALSWKELKPGSEPQPPRTYDGVCYDSKNKVVILTGGGNAMWDGRKEIECNVNDTWVYDPKENDWKEMKPDAPPPAAQMKAACCFDTEHGVMITAINRGLWAYRYKK